MLGNGGATARPAGAAAASRGERADAELIQPFAHSPCPRTMSKSRLVTTSIALRTPATLCHRSVVHCAAHLQYRHPLHRTGFSWAEGPAWSNEGQYFVFSDERIPNEELIDEVTASSWRGLRAGEA
jgi:hypothetical protein